MRVAAVLMAGVLSMAVGGGARAQGSASNSDLSQRLDEIVTSGVESKVYPGAVLIVGRPGETLHAKAYGKLSYKEDAKPVAMDTIYDMASVSKVVGTATAAMKLYEEGRLKLDEPVAKYIPEFTTGSKESVTLKDLMTHVSGLKSYEQFANAEKKRKPGQSTADALVLRIADLPLSTAPRTATIYSCLNMLTMARVNENVIGGRMEDYLRERVYGPLGMKDTVYRLSAEQLQRTAPTEISKLGEMNTGKVHDPLANYHKSEEHCPGNAGVFSTAPDLARYCEMILQEGRAGNTQVFKPETIRLMTSLQSPEGIKNLRGIGWDIQVRPPVTTDLNQTDETRVISHSGYTGTYIWLDKRTKTYFVFLTNRTLDEGPGEAKSNVGPHRAQIAEAVLQCQPEYYQWFRDNASDGTERRGRTPR